MTRRPHDSPECKCAGCTEWDGKPLPNPWGVVDLPECLEMLREVADDVYLRVVEREVQMPIGDELIIKTNADAPAFLTDHSKPGPFVFSFAFDQEILRFEADGRVFVRGEQVDDNQAIYAAVAAFFQRTTRCTACGGLR